MEFKITKLTDESLLRKANEMCTGKESKMTLAQCYRYGHSNMRTQMFWIELRDIPAFVCGHLIRHTHAQPFVQSRRVDRGGADFSHECNVLADMIGMAYKTDDEDLLYRAKSDVRNLPEQFDRMAPQSMGLLLNAEEIINISRKRLCSCASKETREIWENVVALIEEVDPDLAKHCVKPCVAACGLCREPKGCGFNKTEVCAKMIEGYKKLFV